MQPDDSRSALHVLIRLQGRLFALPAGRVVEMMQVGSVTALPNCPPHVRGVMAPRGESFSLLDLREMLGLTSMDSELSAMSEMLAAREQDHRNWIAELERCVQEGEAFTLATDPHRCAFGRWHDQYESDNLLIQQHLARFDEPHKRIHRLAIEIDGLVRGGETERAMARIDQTRDLELSEMIQLFAQARALFEETRREIAIVLSGPSGRPLAFAVDRVEAVHELQVTAEARAAANASAGIAEGASASFEYAFYGPEKELAVLLDPDQLLGASAA